MGEKTIAKKAKKAPELGNTETQSHSQHIHWCFTYNNYALNELIALEILLKELCKCYAFKKELGKEGTPHLQGFLTLLKKTTLIGLKTYKLLSTFHWEVRKGNELENILYICKEDTSVDEIIYQYGFIKKLNIIKSLIVIKELRPFQQDIINLLSLKDDRKIHWVYDPEGCKGKTSIMKYIDYYYNAICCSSGKDSDIYNLFWNYIDEDKKNVLLLNNLDCFVYNVGRKHTFKQYTLLENIKDGFLTNSKYKCGCMNFNSPVVIILANHLPDESSMTGDRWNIIRII